MEVCDNKFLAQLPELPSYAGCGPVEGIVHLYRERAEAFGYGDVQLKFLFTQRLQGKALELYVNMYDKAELSFDKLIRRFSEYFIGRPPTAVSCLLDLQKCKQRSDETLQDFGQRVLKLARGAIPGGDAEALAIQYLFLNMRDEFRTVVTKSLFSNILDGSTVTVHEAVMKTLDAIAVEQLFADLEQKTSSGEFAGFPPKSRQGSPLRCYGCGKLGHRVRYCQQNRARLVEDLRDAKSDCKKLKDELEGQAARYEGAVKELNDKNERLSMEINEQRDQLTEMVKCNLNMKEHLRKNEQAYEDKMKELETRVEALQEDLLRVEASNDDLRVTIDQQGEKLFQLQADKKKALKERDDLRKQVKPDEKVMAELRERLRRDREKLLIEQKELQQRNTVLERMVADLQEELKDIDGESRDWKRQTDELEAEVEALEKRCTDMERNAKITGKQYEEQVTQLTVEKQKVLSEKERLAAENNELKKKLEQLQFDLTAANEKTMEDETKMAADSDEMRRKLVELQFDLTAAKEKIKEDGSKMESLQHELLTAYRKIKEDDTKLEKLWRRFIFQGRKCGTVITV